MNKFVIALVVGSMMLVACGTGDPGGDTTLGGNTPWRVLVDSHQVGGPVEPGIRTATDADSFDRLWSLLGRDVDQPSIDFDDEVMIAFAMSYPSECEFPFIDLVIDESDAVIAASYAGNEPAICAADENQYLVMIGIDRDALRHHRYQLTTSIGAQAATLDL